MTSNGHLIEIDNVSKSFGSHLVLDGIDLAISTGEAVVIAGPSGWEVHAPALHQRPRDDRRG